MRKILMLISTMLVLGFTLTGCATSRELERVQAQEAVNSAKADQALKDSQAAKAAADAATLKADAAESRAAERERIADEKAAKADAVFQKSMRK